MDPITFQKIQAIKNSKKTQLVDSFVLCTFTAVMSCSVFMCCSPFWFPSLCSSFKLFVLNGLPKFGSVLLSTKVLFLVIGNLIVVVLVAESKLCSSSPYLVAENDQSVNMTNGRRDDYLEMMEIEKLVVMEENSKREIDKGLMRDHDDEDDDEVHTLPTEELTKRADDLIARVNRRRRLEARLLLGCCL